MNEHYEVLHTLTGSAEPYEWHDGGIVRRKSNGALFWLTQTGCSCDWFGESFSEEELIPIRDWQQAVEYAKAEFDAMRVADFAAYMLSSTQPVPREWAGSWFSL